jgi:hypothetical protein
MIPKEPRGKIFTTFLGIFLCLHVLSSSVFSRPQASSHYSLCSITCMALCCSAPRRICITSIHPCTSYPKFQPQAFVFLSSLPNVHTYLPYPGLYITVHPSLRIFPSPHSPRFLQVLTRRSSSIHPLPIPPSIRPVLPSSFLYNPQTKNKNTSRFSVQKKGKKKKREGRYCREHWGSPPAGGFTRICSVQVLMAHVQRYT